MRVFLFLFLTAPLTGCLQTPAQNPARSPHSIDEQGLHLEVKKFVLANGLRLLVYENHRLPIFSYYTFFDVGGRHESPELGTTGATHFLEHMMFKGTKTRPLDAFARLVNGNGGSSNAYTTVDSTVYYEEMPADKIDEIILFEADRMANLTLEKFSFENERRVVMEERKMRFENSPRGQIFLSLKETTFAGGAYASSVIGSQQDLKNLNRDQVMDFYHNFYTPDNAIVVVAGDVNAREVYQKVLDAYGGLKASSPKIKAYRRKMENSKRYRHARTWPKEITLHGQSPHPIFRLAYEGVSMTSSQVFAMDMLASVLSSGASSHFHQQYVKGKKPPLSGIFAYNLTLKHNGLFVIGGSLLPQTNLAKFKRRFMKDLTKHVCHDKVINQRSLQRTKNQYLQGIYRSIQSNKDVAEFLGLREFFFNDYNHYKKELEVYQGITVGEVRDACHQVFSGRSTFISLWNKHPLKRGRGR